MAIRLSTNHHVITCKLRMGISITPFPTPGTNSNPLYLWVYSSSS
ncbi:Uncharacterised protein [Vibrio cholerae]|nr:Uncharacterised protein [Vibrio cholerae]